MKAFALKAIPGFFRKPFRWAALYSVLLSCSAAFVLLDTFVIPRAGNPVIQKSFLDAPLAATITTPAEMSTPAALVSASAVADAKTVAEAQAAPALAPTATALSYIEKNPEAAEEALENSVFTETENPEAAPGVTAVSYNDGNISIQIETVRRHDTTIYIAEIALADPSLLKTAFAKNLYGRNIRQTTSEIAAAHNAVLAINGDYYGFRNEGWVLRNGTLYREGGAAGGAGGAIGGGEVLLMDKEGNFHCAGDSLSAAGLANVWQVWSFGPALVKNGRIAVDRDSEIQGRSAPSNPRTAIGQAGPLRYVMIVSNGRARQDQGLSLYQLAEEFAARGCDIAYNLDGGGSSCMVFNGKVLNNPTTNGRNISEREVSDIVYIGYR
jgi:exopolysaccharide biosynthesis protein